MSKIFNISITEFSEDEEPIEENKNILTNTKIKCSKCGKFFEEDNLFLITPEPICVNCNDESIKEQCEIDNLVKIKEIKNKKQVKNLFKSSFVYAGLISAAVDLFLILGLMNSTSASEIIGMIIPITIFTYCFSNQMFYDNILRDIVDWFKYRSFGLPGIIFGLDIGGILLAVFWKIIFPVIMILFSICVFIFGCVLAYIISPFTFIPSVMKNYKENKTDWKKAWKDFHRKYSAQRKGGIYAPYNLAYVVIGLLYGDGDFDKTMDISTRCGLDSDCNPATACGILATITGYSKIPEQWKNYIEPLEKIVYFEGTSYTLEKTYATSYMLALKSLKNDGINTYPYKLSLNVVLPKPITYETNIAGDTIITIRDANNAFVEQIIYSRDIFGRTETTIINSYGCKIEYKESRYYLNGRRYGHYNRYFNEHRRPHKLDNQPHHKRHNIHKEHPRHQLQRPGQKKFTLTNTYDHQQIIRKESPLREDSKD
jgi:hypothetical protein